MNVGALLLLFAVIVASVFGIYYIANANKNAVDTWGNTTTNQTNATQALAGNLTATGAQVGGGAALLVAFILVLVVFGGLVFYAAIPKKRYGAF